MEFGLGKQLLRADDGTLYVRDSNAITHELDVRRPMELLPILESPRETYPADLLASLPLRELLLVALSGGPGGTWTRLAIEGWITPTDLEDQAVHEAVGDVASDRQRPQQLQHAARRLLKAADLPRQPSGPWVKRGRA